ncbi:nicotinate-nucleotide adenylyltransferase [Shewanella avicenniae]|uniref:Probable nicotinate-nucleotide adenylyltransferase n=1 Tax=Shewanella avicenniae TaxID=2814294 RepID=A0ABX7QUS8_9GAMM|nr:nicotinate-nucleotide adenylyltransferase [Shewanella avicenniae]QSX34603.1 nicotinate-nucleotide adenylyltransferase [Shewanella avicenniae]
MRIGIFGGTFDPVHYGHLRPAEAVRQQLQLDELWLMPNRIPPHKAAASASVEQRLAMLALAQQEFPAFSICDIELKREVPSYSVVTLEELRDARPEDTFYFIMGTDSLVTLSTWHQWQRLFDLCHLVICGRDGWQLTAENPVWPAWQQRQSNATQHLSHAPTSAGEIIQLDIELQPYASTLLRQALANSDIAACQQAVPAAVLAFILQQQLYQS